MKSYELLVVVQVSVTGVPAVTEADEPAKVLIVGGAPVGAELSSYPG